MVTHSSKQKVVHSNTAYRVSDTKEGYISSHRYKSVSVPGQRGSTICRVYTFSKDNSPVVDITAQEAHTPENNEDKIIEAQGSRKEGLRS